MHTISTNWERAYARLHDFIHTHPCCARQWWSRASRAAIKANLVSANWATATIAFQSFRNASVRCFLQCGLACMCHDCRDVTGTGVGRWGYSISCTRYNIHICWSFTEKFQMHNLCFCIEVEITAFSYQYYMHYNDFPTSEWKLDGFTTSWNAWRLQNMQKATKKLGSFSSIVYQFTFTTYFILTCRVAIPPFCLDIMYTWSLLCSFNCSMQALFFSIQLNNMWQFTGNFEHTLYFVFSVLFTYECKLVLAVHYFMLSCIK